MAKNISMQANSSSFQLSYKTQEVPFSWSLIGRFNIYNCLATVSVGLSLGIPLQEIAKSLENFQSVPGRLQSVPNSRGLNIFVDFAHTDGALKNVLECLSQLKNRKILITVLWLWR